MVERMAISSAHSSRLVEHGRMISERLDGLRDCQKEALNKLVLWFQKDKTKESTAVVVMPTGSGKTGVICSLPYWFGSAVSDKQLDIDLKQPILVIAPGIDILNQLEKNLAGNLAGKEFQPIFLVKVGAIKDTDRDELRFVRYTVKVTRSTDDVRGLRYCQEDIVLTNAQKWRNQPTDGPTWRDLDDDLFSVIIVDEAHHLPAPQWKNIIDKFKKHAKVIFFTATPFRTDGNSITASIGDYGYAYDLDDDVAIKDRIIRKVEFEVIGSDSEAIQPRAHSTDSDIQNRCVEEVIMKVIARVTSKDLFPDGLPHSAILITRSTDEAERVAGICRDIAPLLTTEYVHSSMPTKQKKAVMQKINKKQVRVFVIVKKLLEGFDYPHISVAGIVTRIRSPLVFAQFVGRARRVIPGEKNVVADIITHEYFEQETVYRKFTSKHWILPDDSAGEDD